MKEIKSIAVITAQGVNIHRAGPVTKIEEAYYRIAGDPYECFRVIKHGKISIELRCVHNLEIEYYPEP